ncbi:hypothetical protein [Kordiimonas marina]|uniref:hypothetical protein n=1 Tax=Kordiimonas marina TaxID=2872312 RepID=UPI001FF1EE0F|nr:hypothetical protein [Kordiimonas marina]MCJ9429840.1 hypothetical protein [Kordiimonas marina]
MTDITDMEDDLEDLFEDYPSLRLVAPFLALAENVRWFRALGETPDAETVKLARDYAAALGFPEAEPAFLPDWADAADAAESTDYNSPAWEAEEQLRAALTTDLLDALDEQTFEMVVAHVGQSVAETIEASTEEAAQDLRIVDEGFLMAASGAAAQACHQAALVAMAGAEDDHPFALRFQLFEKGHWPLGIVGNSFLIF